MVGRGAGGCGALQCLEGAGQVPGRCRAVLAQAMCGCGAQLGIAVHTAVLRAMMHAIGHQGTLPCVAAGRCMWGLECGRWAYDSGRGAARQVM